MKNKINKRRLAGGILAFLVLTVCFFCLMLFTHKIEYGERITVAGSNEYYANTMRREILPGVEYEQTFSSKGERLYSVSVKYEMTQADSDAKWKVQLKKSDGVLIQEWETESAGLTSGEVREYILEKPYSSTSGEVLTVGISLLTEENSGVLLCGSEGDSLLNGTFYEEGREQPGDISIAYAKIENVKVTIIYGVLSAMFLSALVVLLIFGNGFQKIGCCLKQWSSFLWTRKKKVAGILVSYAVVTVLAAGFEIAVAKWLGGESIAQSFLIVRYIFWLFSGWILLTLYLERGFLKKRPEIVVCSILLLIGTVYVLVIQAEAEISWDESIHFWRAVGLSHASTGIANQAESYLYWHSGIPFGLPGSFQQLGAIHDNIQGMYNANIGIGANTDVLTAFYMVAYIPAALLLKIGRGLHLPYWLVFKMGTFANLALYVTLLYFAMKKLKSGKMILAVTASLGSAFFLATVYSYDTWIIGWFSLGMAYFIGNMQVSGKMNAKDMAVIVGASTIALFPKAVYFPLLAVYLWIPKKKFETADQYRRFMSAVLASIGLLASGIVLGYLWIVPIWIVYYGICNAFGKFFERIGKKKRNLLLLGGAGVVIAAALLVVYFVLPALLGEGDIRGGEGVNAAMQVRFILENPLQYAKILINFLKDYYLSFDESWKNIFNMLGYLGTTGCHVISLILLVFVTVTDKGEADQWKGHIAVRWTTVLMSLATICLIVTALYISFTSVANTSVGGCQPRYLIPLLYGFCATISSSRIENKMNKSWYHLGIITVTGGILMYNIWNLVVSRFVI